MMFGHGLRANGDVDSCSDEFIQRVQIEKEEEEEEKEIIEEWEWEKWWMQCRKAGRIEEGKKDDKEERG